MSARGLNALVVDDDPAVLKLLSQMLHHRGYAVTAYSNPEECPLFTTRPGTAGSSLVAPDVVISDFNMPRVNGIDLLAQLHAATGTGPKMAILSGCHMPDSERARLDKIGASYLQKPISMADLFTWLDRTEASPCPLPTARS